mgnify:CR=1 FL=1
MATSYLAPAEGQGYDVVDMEYADAVSYTHLTLPTIYPV